MVEFGRISPPELRPFLGIVTEPFAQLGAGTRVFQPGVDVQRFLSYSARPEPLNQIAHSVIRSFLFIDAFEFDHFSKTSHEFHLAIGMGS
jgi:hypothetical protein